MSFFSNALNKAIYAKSPRVPDYPRAVKLAPSSMAATLKCLPRYAGALNYMPAVLILGSFFVYPTLTERFKWSVGLPSVYVPNEDDLKKK